MRYALANAVLAHRRRHLALHFHPIGPLDAWLGEYAYAG
jgi:hypothetical protein